MAYGYDAGLLERMMPRIKQWETTMGRRMPASMYESLMRGAFGAEADKGVKQRALDQQQSQFDQTKAQQDKAYEDQASAAKTKGYIDTGSTLLTGGLAYKAITKPSAMSEYLAYQKGLGATPGSTATALPGAQTVIGGGAPATGAQFVPNATGIPGAPAATTADTMAFTGGQEAASGGINFAGVGTAVGLQLAQMKFGSMLQPKLDKAGFHYAGKWGSMAGLPGLATGATVDLAKKGWEEVKDIGSHLGDIAGTVICSELLRQKKITDNERKACVIFRANHIPDDMFSAYLTWAGPIVRLMRTSKVANFFLLPFAMNFVGYMLSVQANAEPTLTERLVWKYAWSRCKKIAHRVHSVLEVA